MRRLDHPRMDKGKRILTRSSPVRGPGGPRSRRRSAPVAGLRWIRWYRQYPARSLASQQGLGPGGSCRPDPDQYERSHQDKMSSYHRSEPLLSLTSFVLSASHSMRTSSSFAPSSRSRTAASKTSERAGQLNTRSGGRPDEGYEFEPPLNLIDAISNPRSQPPTSPTRILGTDQLAREIPPGGYAMPSSGRQMVDKQRRPQGEDGDQGKGSYGNIPHGRRKRVVLQIRRKSP